LPTGVYFSPIGACPEFLYKSALAASKLSGDYLSLPQEQLMRSATRKRLGSALTIGVLAIAVGCAKAPNDRQVSQQLTSRFEQDSGLHGKAISVQAAGGVVTLSGTVDSEAQRAAAASYASTLAGVRVVVNNLQVAPAPGPANPTAEAVPPPVAPQTKPQPDVPRRRKSGSPDRNQTNSKSSEPTTSGDQADRAATNQDAGNHDAGNQLASNQSQDAAPAPAPEAPPTPPPPLAPRMLTIQSGTAVVVRLVDSISSETAQAGQTFRATLDSPLSSEWDVAIPAGYTVEGHVVEAKSSGKFAGQPLLVLQLDRISVGDKSYDIQTNQYRREGKNRSTNTAEKVGAGAVLGAIIGGIAGGGKGAGIGAAAGGGAGGGVQAASKPQPVKLASETVLNFTLQSPVTVAQVDQNPDSQRHKLESKQ